LPCPKQSVPAIGFIVAAALATLAAPVFSEESN